MRFFVVSTSTLAMLIALQLLPGRRGVKRLVYASSLIFFLMPSIQPKHRASSTDSDQLMVGLPLSFR